ncbi:pyruvate kinase [Candidatus Hakubella thermalkaliphila]|uniref:Pyruvate kinase n=1 Tax=Candidatus Hakubella thermalkaliphila TaxID=2754717 RepID=A0A6V8PPR7_9ACTN|nr:pyruvate kinase [Candidatus Hakubella thermalkaliphila]GFP24892.1 pyruvate kinase [Candidatus Hakubella thermalkaliphila]GFP27429.1 pyruvate kinase [Candidatus Hakubella thermalkaliphila]GFP34217.1 pyruvate kinase [Candidatus Hakubella thermalkaliphila]
MRRTKIVCTLGPACRSPEMLTSLIRAGADVIRLNAAHGDHATFREDMERIRAISRKMGKIVAIMFDLQGPRIRTGEMVSGGVLLREGEEVVLTSRPVVGTKGLISLSYPHLAQDVRKGAKILLDDGLLELEVEEKKDDEVKCKVITGGILESHKGVNLPNTSLSISSVTDKDVDDLLFALHNDVDWVAMSFVRKAEDIAVLKEVAGGKGFEVKIVAKIEKHEAVRNIDEIIEAADAVMVARGDLGVEMATEKVPIIQKKILEKSIRAGKPVIVATQMLDSMIRNPRPTRAEASDVANAIFDWTDATMLSGETAIGKYPVDAVKTMDKIIRSAEAILDYKEDLERKSNLPHRTTTDAISFACREIARDLQAAAIITATQSGYTARQISKYRPHSPIIACSPDPKVVHQLVLSWGVTPLLVRPSRNIDDMLDIAATAALEARQVKKGDTVVITAGVLVNVPGTTNLIKVHQI